MSLAASEFSIGCAKNSQNYVHQLVQRARREQFPAKLVIADLCQTGCSGLFSSRPGPSQLRALVGKYAHK